MLPFSANTVLDVVLGLAVLALVEAVVERWSLRGRMEHARHHAPADPETGLLTADAFEQRARAEIKRAERYRGTVSFSFWNVNLSDPVAFGASLRDLLRFPEVGFRMSGSLYAVIAPSDQGLGSNVAPRVAACAEPGAVVSGEASFPRDDVNLPGLIRQAAGRMAVPDTGGSVAAVPSERAA